MYLFKYLYAFLTYRRHRNQDLNKQSCQRMLDILILHFQKVLTALVHELKRGLELLDSCYIEIHL